MNKLLSYVQLINIKINPYCRLIMNGGVHIIVNQIVSGL